MKAQAQIPKENRQATSLVPTGLLQGKKGPTGMKEESRRKRQMLQRRAVNNDEVSEVPPIVHEVLRSPGQPLDKETRNYFEPRFGHDFSKVRVHTDAKAAESAQAVNAKAYTVGRDVVFRAGKYAPETTAGRRLLAHELTHVWQQSQSNKSVRHQSAAITIDQPNDTYEWEAETNELRIGENTALLRNSILSGPYHLQRQADISQAPSGLHCTLITGLSTPSGTNVMFLINSAELSAGSRATIRSFTEVWLRGSHDRISIDGYASQDGPQDLNWRISCARANAVRNQLIALGVPQDKLQVAAHGESSEFGPALAENRRVVISTISLSRPTPQAAQAPQLPVAPPAALMAQIQERERQVVCVRRLGGCPNTRPGGIPSSEEIIAYNKACRSETSYTGPDVRPTEQECTNPPSPPEPIEVTVVDERGVVGWAASATRIGEIYITDVRSMVDNVLATAGAQTISRLNILDHGNPNGIEIGDDWITAANVGGFLPQLSRLRGHFTSGGFVHIQHCQAGQNQALVCQLAAAFGVPVYAGTGMHNPVYRINFGDYVRCHPNGIFEVKVGRP